MLHVLLIVVCTAQVILVIGSTGAYARADQNLFFTLFLDEGIETEDPDAQKYTNIFNIQKLAGFARKSLDNYFSLQNDADNYFESYKLLQFDNGEGEKEARVIMDIFYLKDVKVNDLKQIRYILTEDDYKMFAEDKEGDIKGIIQDSKYFILTYELSNTVPINSVKNMECFQWEITQKYNFEERNHISVNLLMNKAYCTETSQIIGNFFGRYIWLHIISMALSFLYLFLNIRYIFNIMNNFGKMKDKFQKTRKRRSAKKKQKKISKKNRIGSQNSP